MIELWHDDMAADQPDDGEEDGDGGEGEPRVLRPQDDHVPDTTG